MSVSVGLGVELNIDMYEYVVVVCYEFVIM